MDAVPAAAEDQPRRPDRRCAVRVFVAALFALVLLGSAERALAQCDVSFSGDIQPIFTARCASAACHGAASEAGLNLTAGKSYAALVSVASSECTTFNRVNPGSPTTSYLMFKLQGSGACFFGGAMPLAGPPLSSTDLNKIR